MKQRILALLLAAGLCLGLIAAAPALAFSDVSGEELSEAVEVLSGLGIVSGYSDGSYHPDDALTRAQFCKLAILTEGHGDQAKGSASTPSRRGICATRANRPARRNGRS